MRRRRPWRSAIPPMINASTTPQRTIASDTPWARSLDPEFVGGERDRLGEEGVEVADDQRDCAEHPERRRAARVEPFRRRPPRHAVGVMAAQRAPREWREQEAEVRHRERVLDRLDGEPTLRVDDAVVCRERATVRGERAVLLTHLVDDVVARLEQARRVARRSG